MSGSYTCSESQTVQTSLGSFCNFQLATVAVLRMNVGIDAALTSLDMKQQCDWICKNRSVYSDRGQFPAKVRLLHEWIYSTLGYKELKSEA